MKKKDEKTKNLVTFEFLRPDTQTALLQDVVDVCSTIKRMKQRLSETELDAMSDGFSRIGSKLISKVMITFAKGGDIGDGLMPILKDATKDSPFLSRVVAVINSHLS